MKEKVICRGKSSRRAIGARAVISVVQSKKENGKALPGEPGGERGRQSCRRVINLALLARAAHPLSLSNSLRSPKAAPGAEPGRLHNVGWGGRGCRRAGGSLPGGLSMARRFGMPDFEPSRYLPGEGAQPVPPGYSSW